MAEPERSATPEPGAPVVPKDAIDPDLVKLGRPRPKIGVITAAGTVFLAVLFLVRINPDRRFSGSSSDPARVSVADVVAGNVGTESYVAVDAQAEPLMAQAIRAGAAASGSGLRVVPVRGTGGKLWLVLPGDGWDTPQQTGYVGRLRRLGDLPFAAVVDDYAAQHPVPVFAAASAVRAAPASGQLATVGGETVTVHDADRVAFDLVTPDAAIVVATINDRLPTVEAWSTELASAGIATTDKPDVTGSIARFHATGTRAELVDKLAKHELWAARVDPIGRHVDTTWSALRASPPDGFANVDLVGVYVTHGIPDGAYALITGEDPADYWYVLPVTIVVGLIALLFAWALVRAVKRDLLPTRA